VGADVVVTPRIDGAAMRGAAWLPDIADSLPGFIAGRACIANDDAFSGGHEAPAAGGTRPGIHAIQLGSTDTRPNRRLAGEPGSSGAGPCTIADAAQHPPRKFMPFLWEPRDEPGF
jgi:hypothetical protein